MLSAETDALIARFEGALDPAGRASFRVAAEAALAAMPPASRGPGSIHRELENVWRRYFRPPSGVETGWEKNERRRPYKERFEE
jgi:hypothetical protein